MGLARLPVLPRPAQSSRTGRLTPILLAPTLYRASAPRLRVFTQPRISPSKTKSSRCTSSLVVLTGMRPSTPLKTKYSLGMRFWGVTYRTLSGAISTTRSFVVSDCLAALRSIAISIGLRGERGMWNGSIGGTRPRAFYPWLRTATLKSNLLSVVLKFRKSFLLNQR